MAADADALKQIEPAAPLETPREEFVPRRPVGTPRKWFRRATAGIRLALTRIGLRRETPAERINRLAEERERAKHKALMNAARLACKQYCAIIPVKLADFNICYRYRRSVGGSEKTKYVAIEDYKYGPQGIFIKVDWRPDKSPRGVIAADLNDPRILETLSYAIGKPVTVLSSPKAGFWYYIPFEGEGGRIPTHVQYHEMIERRPPSADKMALPIGVGDGRRIIWRSLNQMYGMLIAGSPGTGKSNIVNAFLCTLIGYNRPDQLQLVLIDLKGGIELGFYRDLTQYLMRMPPPKAPRATKRVVRMMEEDEDGNLTESETETVQDDSEVAEFDMAAPFQPALIEKREHVPHVMNWVMREIKTRAALISARKGVKTIGEYNFRSRENKLPYLVFVIDEYADIRLDRKIGRLAEGLLTGIANQGRAVGVYVIVCTQTPVKEVIPTAVKNALAAKLCFSVSNDVSSRLLLSNGDAARLPYVGRAVFEYGTAHDFVQTPYISNNMVEERVKDALAGKLLNAPDQLPACDVNEYDVCLISLEHFGGRLLANEIHPLVAKRGMTHAALEILIREMIGTNLVVNNTAYHVQQRSLHKPVSLVAVDQLEHGRQAPAAQPPTQPAHVSPGASIQERIAAHAVTALDGDMSAKRLMTQFGGELKEYKLRDVLSGMDGQTYTVNGQAYTVTPPVNPAGGRKAQPRRIVPAQIDPPVRSEPAEEPAAVDSGNPVEIPASELSGALTDAVQPTVESQEAEIRDGDDAIDNDNV